MVDFKEGLLLSLLLAFMSSLLLSSANAARVPGATRVGAWTRLDTRRWTRGDTERLKRTLESRRPVPKWARPASFVPREEAGAQPPSWMKTLQERIQRQGGYKVPHLWNQAPETELSPIKYERRTPEPEWVERRKQARRDAGPEGFVDPINYRPKIVQQLAPWQREVEARPRRRLDQEYSMAKVLLGNSPLPSTGHSYHQDAKQVPLEVDVGPPDEQPLLYEYAIKRNPNDFVPTTKQEAQITEQDYTFEKVMSAMQRQADENRADDPSTRSTDIYGDLDQDLYG